MAGLCLREIEPTGLIPSPQQRAFTLARSVRAESKVFLCGYLATAQSTRGAVEA